jgi:hypothetical protein
VENKRMSNIERWCSINTPGRLKDIRSLPPGRP